MFQLAKWQLSSVAKLIRLIVITRILFFSIVFHMCQSYGVMVCFEFRYDGACMGWLTIRGVVNASQNRPTAVTICDCNASSVKVRDLIIDGFPMV